MTDSIAPSNPLISLISLQHNLLQNLIDGYFCFFLLSSHLVKYAKTAEPKAIIKTVSIAPSNPLISPISQ